MRIASRVRVALLLPILILAFRVTGAHAQQKPVPYPDALERMNDAIDALTRKVWPSVVQISVSGYGVAQEKGHRGGKDRAKCLGDTSVGTRGGGVFGSKRFQRGNWEGF